MIVEVGSMGSSPTFLVVTTVVSNGNRPHNRLTAVRCGKEELKNAPSGKVCVGNLGYCCIRHGFQSCGDDSV